MSASLNFITVSICTVLNYFLIAVGFAIVCIMNTYVVFIPIDCILKIYNLCIFKYKNAIVNFI